MPYLDIIAGVSDERVYVTGLSTYPTYRLFALIFWGLGIGLLIWWGRRRRASRLPVWPVFLTGISLICPFSIFAPVFIAAEEVKRSQIAPARARALVDACQLYMADNGERFPLAANWESSTRQYWREPASVHPGPLYEPAARFAFNRNLSGRASGTLYWPGRTVVLFVSKLPGPNASGGESDLYWTRVGDVRFTFVGLLLYNWKHRYSDEDLEKVYWEATSEGDL